MRKFCGYCALITGAYTIRCFGWLALRLIKYHLENIPHKMSKICKLLLENKDEITWRCLLWTTTQRHPSIKQPSQCKLNISSFSLAKSDDRLGWMGKTFEINPCSAVCTPWLLLLVVVVVLILVLVLSFNLWEFFTSVLADGLSLELEWQQISSSLQDSFFSIFWPFSIML